MQLEYLCLSLCRRDNLRAEDKDLRSQEEDPDRLLMAEVDLENLQVEAERIDAIKNLLISVLREADLVQENIVLTLRDQDPLLPDREGTIAAAVQWVRALQVQDLKVVVRPAVVVDLDHVPGPVLFPETGIYRYKNINLGI